MEYSLQQQNDDYIMDLEDKVLNLKRRIREMKMCMAGELPDGRKEPKLNIPVQRVPTHSDVDKLKDKLLGRK
tara:strand:- start:209 stop:424 length:216 start_codon:yes stop_codon:yes gene_type:complete